LTLGAELKSSFLKRESPVGTIEWLIAFYGSAFWEKERVSSGDFGEGRKLKLLTTLKF
jgi:hypothetical protein